MSSIPDYILDRYSRNRYWRLFPKESIFHFIQAFAARKDSISVCEFGCGDGMISCQIARVMKNTTCVGFDISPEFIEVAKKNAVHNNVQERVTFVVANAERKPLEDTQFDVLLALSIIHHINIHKAIPNLLENTKPGGMIIFSEPIAFSRRLQKIWDFIPIKKDASPGERQLSQDEVKYLISVTKNPKVLYYNFIGRLARLFRNRNKIDKGHPVTKLILMFLCGLDMLLFRAIPSLQKYAGQVLIVGFKPKETNVKRLC